MGTPLQNLRLRAVTGTETSAIKRSISSRTNTPTTKGTRRKSNNTTNRSSFSLLRSRLPFGEIGGVENPVEFFLKFLHKFRWNLLPFPDNKGTVICERQSFPWFLSKRNSDFCVRQSPVPLVSLYLSKKSRKYKPGSKKRHCPCLEGNTEEKGKKRGINSTVPTPLSFEVNAWVSTAELENNKERKRGRNFLRIFRSPRSSVLRN